MVSEVEWRCSLKGKVPMTETKEGKEGSLRCQAARGAAGLEAGGGGGRHSTESLCSVFEELMRKGEGGAR